MMMKLTSCVLLFLTLLVCQVSMKNLYESSEESLVRNDLEDVEERNAAPRRYAKKLKPFETQQGYLVDINIEAFKSMRYCYAHDVCKFRYKQYFECVCPKYTLCMGNGGLFDAKCSSNLMPYVWIQNMNPGGNNNNGNN